MAAGSDDFADAPTIEVNTFATPTSSAALTIEAGDEAAHAADWMYTRSAWWRFVLPAWGDASELEIRDETVTDEPGWVVFFVFKDVGGVLVDVDFGDTVQLFAEDHDAGDVFYIKAATWDEDGAPEDLPYAFSIGRVVYSWTDWIQGDNFWTDAAATVMATGENWTGADLDTFTTDHDLDEALNVGILAALDDIDSTGVVAPEVAVNSQDGLVADVQSNASYTFTTPGTGAVSAYRQNGAYLSSLPAVAAAADAYNPAEPTDGPDYVARAFEVGGTAGFTILDAHVELFLHSYGEGIDSPLKVRTWLKPVNVRGEANGTQGATTVVDTFTYTAGTGSTPYERTVEFNTGPKPVPGGWHINFQVDPGDSFPWAGTDPEPTPGSDGEQSHVRRMVAIALVDPVEAGGGIIHPMVSALLKPPRHRWQIRTYMAPLVTALVRRPLRLFPRSDGLGMSSTRRLGISNRSVQSSLRRAGGTYI